MRLHLHRRRRRVPAAALTLATLLVGTGFPLLTTGCDAAAPAAATADDTIDIRVAGEPFHVELALDEASRFQGLSDRARVDPHGGMLFVFPDVRKRNFVMRRCLVPIDIAYLDPSGRVVETHAMQVEPEGTPEDQLARYPSRYPAQFALELAGGTIARIGLSDGDAIGMDLEALKSRAE